MKLRDGGFRTLMGLGSEGVNHLPSLHAALGLLFMVAVWPLPYLRWAAIALNVLMIAATPVDGGRYFRMLSRVLRLRRCAGWRRDVVPIDGTSQPPAK